MSTEHPQYVKDALDVAREVLGISYPPDETDGWDFTKTVLALAERGLLLTPEDKACVEACVYTAGLWPDDGIKRGPIVSAGRAILAKRKKPERWTVLALTNPGWNTHAVALDNVCMAEFHRESDARAYAAQKNAEEAKR
jgi:hypothetical protein